MAFQFDPNQSPIDGAAAVAQLVAVLVTAGWAIHAYGDGAARTAGGVGFSATSLRDNSGAWVAVLEPAGGPGTLVFQRSAAGAGDNTSWWVAYAHDGLNADGNGNTVDTEFTAGDLKNILGTIGNTHGSGAAALFPAEFEESALGSVPKGWRVGTVADLLVLQRGFDLPASKRTDGPFTVFAASGPHGTHSASMAAAPGVVTGRSGVIGRVFYVHESYWPLNTALNWPPKNGRHEVWYFDRVEVL